MKLQSLNTKKHKIVSSKLNKQMRELFKTDIHKYKKRSYLIPFIQDAKIATYQSDVLQYYLNEFKLDIDKLDFTVKCNSKANGTSELFKTIANELRDGCNDIGDNTVSIVRGTVSGINTNIIRSKFQKRPHYAMAYDLLIDGDKYKSVKVFLSDGKKKNSTTGIRFSFNPNHFTHKEICQLFMYVQKIVGSRAYSTLMNRARVTRLDLGINLFGMCSLFAYTIHSSESLKSGCLYPQNGHVAETVEHGTNSKLKIYDKLLEMAKSNTSDINNLAFTTRVEHQNRVASKVNLSELETCSQLLQKLQFVDPNELVRVRTRVIKTLLKKRSRTKVQQFITEFNEYNRKPIKLLEFDSARLAKQHNARLKDLKKLILEPKKRYKQLNN